ncbi:flippase [Clostridiaceae bacterium OM08-6BH]|nr:flippase [Clostridiaceae bacterium OM08-6BH]
MRESRSKYLLKNTLIFSIGNFATKIISFFLIPLYTNLLSTYDYGIVDLVFTIATIAVPILTLNIMEAVMRFNLDKDVNHDEITKIGIVLLLAAIIIGVVLIPISNDISSLADLSLLIYFYCISSATSQIFLCDLRGKELLVQYSIGNILNTLLIAIFNIVFLLLFKWGIRGYLLAYTLANCIVAFYAFAVGKVYHSFFSKTNKEKMHEMIKYSVVLIPNSFMWWIMNSSDHLMVTSMIGVSANGIYAISYKLPTLISTFTGIFNQAWSYSAIKEDDSEDITSYTNKVFRTMIAGIMFVGISMMTFIKPFLKIYVSKEYFIAWKYTPFLIVGCVYLTLGTFMSTSYTVHKDSKGFLMSGLFGASLNIILNFLLIPIIGVYGAALATCISYISVFVFRVFNTRKYMKYNVLTKEFLMGSTALICSGFLIYSNTVVAQAAQIIILLLIIVSYKEMWLPLLKKISKRI